MADVKIEQLKNEASVISKLCDVLKYSSFTGHMAQDVAIGQMYLQGLYKHMLLEVEKLEATPTNPANVVTVLDQKPQIEVVK